MFLLLHVAQLLRIKGARIKEGCMRQANHQLHQLQLQQQQQLSSSC